MRIRATTISLWDSSEMIVPNKEFITNKLVNCDLAVAGLVRQPSDSAPAAHQSARRATVMRGALAFFKTTVVGGLVFLVPVIILIAILGKALQLMSGVAAPLAGRIPVDSVVGIALANVIAGVAVVILCFAAGVGARSSYAKKAVDSLDSRLMSMVPGYALVKGMTGSLGGDGAESLTPVMVKFNDSSQIAFEVEKIEDGRVVVYLPGAPNPWSGAVLLMEEDRVERLGKPPTAAIRHMRTLGRGTGNLLRSQPGRTDRPPSG
jgi:uncharacterized membrane protein